MWQIFNTFIVKVLPLIPSFIIWQFAKRYVAGDNKKDALIAVKNLNNKGFSVTLDILGEHTVDEGASINITKEYKDIFFEINQRNVDCNISIKPSHIGMDINDKCITNNMHDLILAAKRYDNFLRIDMEDSTLTNKTIDLYNQYNKSYSNIGMVLQAYLFRTEIDLRNLIENSKNINFRLCKGIYRESSDISWHNKNDINNNFIKLLKIAFKNNIYVGIATHDIYLIEKTYDIIKDLNISKERFEFQSLYGVPMYGWLEKHLKHGYKVRIYVPFGGDWYDYSIRRLKENPNIARYVIRDIFKV